MADDTMLQQAIGALRDGEKVRARDLLTRLIKTNPTNPEYWLWMSTVVETTRERTYCLQEALRLDPQNLAARRGLVMIGALPGSEGASAEAGTLRREWSARGPDVSQVDKTGAKVGLRRFALMSVGGVAVVSMLIFGLIGLGQPKNKAPVVLSTPRPLKPSATLLPTNTLVVKTATPTFVGPTPLWMLLEETYTPTPFYGKTPHPRSEAFGMGVKRFEQGAWDDVVMFMEQAVVSEPDAVDAYYYMGEAYRMQAKYDQAIEQYSKAIQANMRYAPAYLGRARSRFASDPKAAVDDDLNKAIELDPNMGEAYLERGYEALQREDYPAALESLPQAEKLLPGSPIIYMYEAQANLAMKHAEEALNQARKANELDSTLLLAYRVLAEAFQANGKPGESIQPLNTYLLYAPEDAHAQLLLGTAQLALGDPESALKSLNEAVKDDNNYFDAYLLRGEIYLQLKQADAALDDFSTATKMNTKSFPANLNKGRAMLEAGHSRDAYNQLVRTRALAETDAQTAAVIYWEALSLEALGDRNSAIKDWQALLRMPAEALQPGWEQTAKEHLSLDRTPAP